jgi:deazaflavin-dependent oxidoreductase (nitroreductase family)
MGQETKQLDIPSQGTRGRRVTDVFFKLLKPLAAGQVSRYRKRASAEPPKFNGFPIVLLTTVGSKTGRERTAVLGGFQEDGGSWLVVGSKGGSLTHPAWFINLCKHPDKVWLEVGNRKFQARPELLKGDEYEAAYAKVVAVSPQYAGYRKVTDREIPVVRLTPIS